MSAELPLTGERTIPGIPEENYWFRRHEAAYHHVVGLAAGRTVLEVGCGEGYGTALLAGQAQRVIGVDYDALTVAHAASTYPTPTFLRANLAALPIAAASIDLVATLQVIEHVWNHSEFVRECRRVLRRAGRLVVTTPNRLTFSPGLHAPVNPFHTKEFAAAELTDLLADNGFEIEAVCGLHAGAHLAELDRRYGSFVAAQLSRPPTEWPPQLLADVVAIRSADFPIVASSGRDVDESLDLVVLARRR